MDEYIKREIKPFNEFWINCESTMLHSLLITLDEKYRVMAYTNNYVYEVLHFPTPSRKWINEVRVKPEIMDIFHVVLKNKREVQWNDYDKAVCEIKDFLKQGKIVMAGVDLFYWIPMNMCYHKHHADHYAIINGFDDEKDIFFVMDTDNVKYQEFEMPAENVMEAIAHCDLHYDALVYDLCTKEEIEPYMFDKKELIWRAKRIYKSLRPLSRKYFWLMEEEDYKKGFYRDMCVMYILQINCRMKANRLLFEYLIEKEMIAELAPLQEDCYRIERRWTAIKNKVSKAYFAESSVTEMMNLGEQMMEQFEEERKMWKAFVKLYEKCR